MVGRVWAIAAAVTADALRRKIVWVVGFFAAVMALAIPQLPSYGVGVVAGVFREVALALTFAAGLVLTLALSVTRLPGEMERRTVYPLLARPVHRWEYLVGSWLGVTLTVGACVMAFDVVNQAIGLVRYGDPMWRLIEGSLAIWLEMGVVAAFAIALSTVTGAVTSTIGALVFLFIAHSRSTLLGAEPGGLAALYPSLDAFNIINQVAHGTGVSFPYGLSMLAVFAGWCALLLAAGSLLFAQKDL